MSFVLGNICGVSCGVVDNSLVFSQRRDSEACMLEGVDVKTLPWASQRDHMTHSLLWWCHPLTLITRLTLSLHSLSISVFDRHSCATTFSLHYNLISVLMSRFLLIQQLEIWLLSSMPFNGDFRFYPPYRVCFAWLYVREWMQNISHDFTIVLTDSHRKLDSPGVK